MKKIAILLSLLFVSSCSFGGNKGQIKHQITRCWVDKKYNDEKYSDSRVVLHLNLNKDGSVDKLSVIESKCGKLSKDECDKFVNSAVEAVHKSSPIKNLFVDQYEDWKEINLNFDPFSN
ncbi:cell envelope integrity protein TolA [Candidatus Bandiella numerosa]|uniref:cell envelope integrity protein TolA n=1 Tax=Candidatus Bandiella numerosa TaxID=2570586 RepID=UPI001F47858B|nr:cell envelope integrity protein TolA [Candidatus Bandiella numerosa]